MADALRRTRRHEELVLPADQPATPARRLMTMTTGERIDLKGLAALFSRDVQPGILKEGAQAQRMLDAGTAPARRQLRSQQVPWDVAVDFALGALQETVSGDDAAGFRVGLSFPFEKSARNLNVYVVPDGGEYRIAALSTVVSMLGEESLRRLQRGDLAGARKWLDWAREETGTDLGNGGDPIPQSPFPALWAERSAASADDARCAAAALLTTSRESSARALPLLRACRDAAGDPARRNAFDLALALGDAAADRFAEMEEDSGRLLAAAPGSERAERLHALALISLGRWDEIRALAERRLQRAADDPWALQLLASDALHARDLDQAEARLRQIVKSGKATASNYNELAWLLLERGRVDDEALDFGQRAATLSDYTQSPALHTLACLYAEKGRTAEAYRIIVQAIGAKPDEAPGADDWYVFGRLAEQYGLPDVARKYYRKVTAPKSLDAEPMSTHALATRRLGALGEEKKPQRRAAL
jgi:tetratricopeptide (TPR) repeat protein